MLRGVTRRAQEAGALRRDFVLSDLLLILSAGRGLHAGRPDLLPAAAHRFASLAIDGLAAAPRVAGQRPVGEDIDPEERDIQRKILHVP
jgi:hypothetical protein